MDDIYISRQYSSKEPNNQRPNNPNQPKKKKKSAGRIVFRTFFAVFILLALIVVLTSGYVYTLFGNANYNSDVHGANAYISDSELMSDSNVKNILLLGIDTDAESTSSRSDTMMLLTIDNNNKKIKLTSFLRDSWVNIPDAGYAKMNASYSHGGVQLTIDTIEYNFKVKIDNYMLVDYAAFTKIVDALNGVRVEVTEGEAKYLNKTYGLNIQPGSSVLLNGSEALCFCRIRKLDSDFFRTSRQRKLLSSIIAEAKDASASELLNIAEDILPNVQTDLSQSDLTKLALSTILTYKNYAIEETRVPFENTWKSATKKGQSVIEFDIDQNASLLKNYLYSDEAPSSETK